MFSLTWFGVLILAFIGYKLLDRFLRSFQRRQEGEYVLITGCDSGFGHGLAKRLDSKGCNVLATCLSEKGEIELQKACSSRLRTIRMDVSSETSVAAAFRYVKETLPVDKGLWGVVNNAGFAGSAVGPVDWMTLANFRELMEVNLFGLINVTLTFLPLVKKARGRIVNTASTHGRTCLDTNVPYSCSKYGVEAFSDGLRRQMRLFGCSVHLIEPGFHKTNIINRDDNERQLRTAWDRATPEIKQAYGDQYVEKLINDTLNTLLPKIASDKIDEVVDAYEHALFGRFPRARYLIGFDANYFWMPVQNLPEWLGDWILTILAPKI